MKTHLRTMATPQQTQALSRSVRRTQQGTEPRHRNQRQTKTRPRHTTIPLQPILQHTPLQHIRYLDHGKKKLVPTHQYHSRYDKNRRLHNILSI